jgi:hypothetical protein
VRKRIITDLVSPDAQPAEPDWLDLAAVASVEVTSENPNHPVEAAFLASGSGWRAAEPGAQTLRLVFDAPTRVTRVRLSFRKDVTARTQEFALRYSADGGQSYREVVRQQFTFAPPGTTAEVEEYRANLDGVTALELRIVPDIGGRSAVASVERFEVAAE